MIFVTALTGIAWLDRGPHFAKWFILDSAHIVKEAVLHRDFPSQPGELKMPESYPLRVWTRESWLREQVGFATGSGWEGMLDMPNDSLFLEAESEQDADIIVTTQERYVARGTVCHLPEDAGGVVCLSRFSDSPLIIIVRDIPEAHDNPNTFLKFVLRHELGHAAFALEHRPGEDSIMGDLRNVWMAISYLDVREVREKLAAYGMEVPMSASQN